MIDFIKQTPSVYSQESRDYQIISRLYSALLNYSKLYIDNMRVWNKNIDNSLTQLRAKTLNFNPNHIWPNESLEQVITCFKYLMMNKGTTKALQFCCYVLMRVNNLTGDIPEPEIEGNVIRIKIPVQLATIGIVDDLFSYLIPAGFTYRIYQYVSLDITNTTEVFADDILTETSGINYTRLGIYDGPEVTNGNRGRTLYFNNVNLMASGSDYVLEDGPSPAYIHNIGVGTQKYAEICMIGGNSIKETSSQTIINGVVEKIISSGAEITKEYQIPTEIINLSGYGISRGDKFNYLDLTEKKYHQVVNRVNLGSLSWGYSASRAYFYATAPADSPATIDNGHESVCSIYDSFIGTTSQFYTLDKVVLLNSKGFSSSKRIVIRDSAYTDAEAFKSAMNGVYLHYELETPVETDISQYITHDNLIETEVGGTVLFYQDSGKTIPVPNKVTYMVKH